MILVSCQHKTTQNQITPTPDITWKLIPEHSSLSIITTKNNSIAEVSEFTDFTGQINPDGKLLITLNMNSLETNIPIRNERIQQHLFQTDIYDTAEIRANLKPTDLNIGVHSITFDVDLHGVSAILEAEFMVFEQFGNKIVTLHKPLIINAKTFGLENGITTLKNLANLDTIDLSVPVNLILSFESE
jgi:polyisoprenoid-binding protein YceI